MNRISRRLNAWIQQGLISSALLAFVIMLGGGLGFWWIDPRVQSFSDGLWLAFTTAATVGYGDHVPSTNASRAFAVIVVIMGLAVLSLVTASISALLVQREERQIEQELLNAIRLVLARVERLERTIEDLKKP